jgi:hypothetical protein
MWASPRHRIEIVTEPPAGVNLRELDTYTRGGYEVSRVRNGDWLRSIYVPDIATSYRDVSYQVYNHLQDTMLVAIKDHIFETPETERPQVSLPNGSTALVQVRIVWSFELDA